MRKRTEREIERQSRWQEIVRGQEQSGQSVRAYCRRAGIEESAFYWWRRELTRRGRQRNEAPRPARGTNHGKPARPAVQRPSDAVAEIGFLPVQVAEERGAEGGRSIEIVLDGGRLLRIPPGFDRPSLLRVLDALEGRGC
jgi:transposase-like protein